MFGASLPRRAALCALAVALVILPAQPAQARSSVTPEKASVAKRDKRVARCGRKLARRQASKPVRKRAQRRRRCLGRIATARKDRTPPNVAFTAPAAGATVSGVLSGAACEASASDAHGVDRVEFSVDGTPLNVERVMPYNCVWDTSTVAAGSHVLTARAVD